MSLFRRNRWFVLAGGITLAFAVASLSLRRGFALTAISDLTYLLLSLALAAAMLVNARAESGTNRRFWALMGAGCLLLAANQFAWAYCEVYQRTTLPDPSFMDVVLFMHLIPMIAAIGLRPHLRQETHRFRTGTLDFLLLLVWWVFLYAFVVLPAQYISLNVDEYDRTYMTLYVIEGGVVVVVLGLAARGASVGWRRLYLHLMAASALYALDSQALNLAVANGNYYSGSLYDVALIAAAGWMAAATMSARHWRLEAAPAHAQDTWGGRSQRMAMLAILTLPVLGLWAYRWDQSPAPARAFRLFTVLAAMVLMGIFIFVRQYLQDQALIDLLADSRRSFEKEQRLHTHLVQREKLASLGELIAGAAQEIDQPLTAIMEYSEKLWSNERLSPEQDALVRKIVNHSQRTRDLISNLLSFAQQRSGEKTQLDLSTLLQRSVQVRELQLPDQKIRIEVAVDPHLPRIWGDAHQLFQSFAQIVENALDALEEAGGGVLRVSAERQQEEVVVQFSDSGPGLKEPHRVFDPFYTTKPIGKGTGLGLSAVYGVVQDHGGQITCQNKPEGGALFVVRLPVAKPAESHVLAAAQS